MGTSEIFDTLLQNLKVGDSRTAIVSRRDEITKALNKNFRSKEASTDYKLMVGSYGRHTAIRGISDLDMTTYSRLNCDRSMAMLRARGEC